MTMRSFLSCMGLGLLPEKGHAYFTYFTTLERKKLNSYEPPCIVALLFSRCLGAPFITPIHLRSNRTRLNKRSCIP